MNVYIYNHSLDNLLEDELLLKTKVDIIGNKIPDFLCINIGVIFSK